jgi:hypothetical protein
VLILIQLLLTEDGSMFNIDHKRFRISKVAIFFTLLFLCGCYDPWPRSFDEKWFGEESYSTQISIGIAWPWSMGIKYSRGERVAVPPFNERHIYESLRDKNIDHDPRLEPEWWKPLVE